MEGTVIRHLACTESSNRSTEAAVGLTEDMGIQKVLPIPKAKAGVTRPYPYNWLLLASFTVTQYMELVVHDREAA
jgi:hypothetical protein